MADRFGNEYRPPHGGYSIFPNTRPMQSPFKPTNSAVWDWRGSQDGDNYGRPPAGGSKVPSKPKKPAPRSSGGMALPLPIGGK